jgi:CRISPR/Cas system CSM-associated protein Csm3 (group 7 of RAMP superfamily)
MPWIYLDLPLTITVEGPLHIGTGYDRGLIQRTVARDANGNVYIPGSSLKGKVRNACENLARLAGLKVCDAPRPETMCGGRGAARCLVCRVFGTPGGNAPDGRELFWHDAHPTGKWRGLTATRDRPKAWPVGQTMARTQVQLSRARGMAAEDRLYTSEFATRGLEFTGRVSGWLKATPCSAGVGYYEVNLLLAGLRLVETLGGGRSRGAGRCEIKLPDEVTIRVDGQDKPEKYTLTDLLAAAEWLVLFTDEVGGE